MRSQTRKTQAGFSMIEMLMAAFILAIGILGLTMLQVMSLRAAGGSRNLSTAVQVAERIMDQIEMEGRLTWLNLTDAVGSNGEVTGLKYIGKLPLDAEETFTAKGQVTDSSATDPIDRDPIFYATPTESEPVGDAVTGKMHDYTVTVRFVDHVTAASTPVERTVTITRRIIHG